MAHSSRCDMTTVRMNLGSNSYDVNIGKGVLRKVGELFNLDRRVLILTDSGVPSEYAEVVASVAKQARIMTVAEGECSKSMQTLSEVLETMIAEDMTRRDCVVAVGGGVVSDLAGFAAASYMRGIDFYNIPTTVLSQVDASIGGKTAINFGGIKNIVGAFHQPRGVLVDIDCLKTLDARQVANGLSEAVKMALTSNKELFEYLEGVTPETLDNSLEHIIVEAVKIKRTVVEADEHEDGLRRILNFGHTLGHGIEAGEGLHGLYHGECVALGMLPLCSKEVRDRLIPVLTTLGLPTEYHGNIDEAIALASHDKKRTADGVNIILVPRVGEFEIRKVSIYEFGAMVKEVFK